MSDAESAPLLRINRDIEGDGIGKITYQVLPGVLEIILREFGVQEVGGLSEENIRELCDKADPSVQQRNFEIAEGEYPGLTILKIPHDGREVEFRSGDAGFDTVMRMVPGPIEEEARRFDPRYSTVHFELAVFQNPPSQLAQCVLRRTLHPPSPTE